MQSRRLTKAERRELELQQLKQRVSDIIAGAMGCAVDTDCMIWAAPDLRRAHTAVKETFNNENIPDYVWTVSNIDAFDDIDELAKWLYGKGVRP